MSTYRHAREVEWDYPATRDEHGVLLGIVQPGDVRDLDEPPDMFWLPAGGDDGAAAEGESSTGEQMADPEPDPAQTSEAGVTGSEEG